MNSTRMSLVTERRLFLLAIVSCVVFTINAITVPVMELPHHIIKNVNEGWNAYFTARAMTGLPIYPQPPETIINNYPPLSFYIVGELGKVVGDFIVAGRLMSVISFFVIVATLGLIVAKRTVSMLAGIFAAVYFAAVFSVFPGGRIGLDDPQLLGHAVMLVGFAVFWLGDGRVRSTFLGAALMVVAGLIKHNIIALPIAVTLSLAIFDRKLLVRWLMAVILSLAVASLVLISLWGTDFIHSISTPRLASLGKAIALITILRDMLPSLTVFILLCFFPKMNSVTEDQDFFFSVIFVLVSLAVAFLLYGGEGVSSNAAFDVVISVALSIGLCVGALPAGREKTSIIAALVLGQYFMITAGIGTAFGGTITAAMQRDRLDIEYVAAHSGDALCNDPTLCYWAKKDFLFDFFNMNQLYAMKKRDPEVFLNKLRRREFTVVALDKSWNIRDRAWIDEFFKILDSSYRIDRTSEEHVFYVPKGN